MTLLIPRFAGLDPELAARLQEKIGAKAKPLGSLGRLEALAVKIGLIQETLTPRVDRVEAYIFAADHGMNAEGVSAYPSSVTLAMVKTFLAGRASVNALASSCGVEVFVVDAGVDAELAPCSGLILAKGRRGTRNAAVEPAMTEEEVNIAVEAGMKLAHTSSAEGLVIGEMGIGNSAAAALLTHRLAPASLEACIGLGAGHDPEGLARKTAVLVRAAARSQALDPLEGATPIWRTGDRHDGRRFPGRRPSPQSHDRRRVHLQRRSPGGHQARPGAGRAADLRPCLRRTRTRRAIASHRRRAPAQPWHAPWGGQRRGAGRTVGLRRRAPDGRDRFP